MTPADVPLDQLAIWVVYDRPRDYPTRVVVRAQLPQRDGTILAGQEAFLFASVDDARTWLFGYGLTRLERQAGDDPVIVETWI